MTRRNFHDVTLLTNPSGSSVSDKATTLIRHTTQDTGPYRSTRSKVVENYDVQIIIPCPQFQCQVRYIRGEEQYVGCEQYSKREKHGKPKELGDGVHTRERAYVVISSRRKTINEFDFQARGPNSQCAHLLISAVGNQVWSMKLSFSLANGSIELVRKFPSGPKCQHLRLLGPEVVI